jgi:hypothetical protein
MCLLWKSLLWALINRPVVKLNNSARVCAVNPLSALAGVKWIHNQRHGAGIPHGDQVTSCTAQESSFGSRQDKRSLSPANRPHRYGSHLLSCLRAVSIPEGKATGTWNWPHIFNIEVKIEWSLLPHPHVSSWCGAEAQRILLSVEQSVRRRQ